jgi:hypothetical protein
MRSEGKLIIAIIHALVLSSGYTHRLMQQAA